MFWRFGGYANISTLDTLLDKADVTVEELLDESDLIQELKQQNGKLIEFLRDEPVLQKLLDYVIADKPPEVTVQNDKSDTHKSEGERAAGLSFFGRARSRSKARHSDEGESEQDKGEALRKKYAYVACEVLSSEVWSITEAVMEDIDHLKVFWNYLHRPAPLDPLQAGYFTKVNEALLDKKTEQMLAFFKSLDGIVPAMLQHVDCPMVMDLLLKIISLEKHEGGVGIVDWLQGQGLIPSLLEYLGPEHNSATQTSAGDFLKAIITISANATTQDQSVIGPNELTRQLVSESCIATLIADMLRGGNALTVGVGIVIEVIRKNNSDYDMENQAGPAPKTSDPIYLGTLLRQFANHIPEFMDLVRSKSATRPLLKAAFGGKIEPLGFDRFKTCELMAELLHCSNMGLLNERGAEDDVRRRDAEREKLKAEGRLATPRPASSLGHDNSHDEFGSSVDSHGFHHAKKPRDEDMDDDRFRSSKLSLQNATDEDGFEKVNIPSNDDLPDEVTFDDFPEKLDTPKGDTSIHDIDVPRPLSPSKKPALKLASNSTAQNADSPTSAGVTSRIEGLGMEPDGSSMTEYSAMASMKDASYEYEEDLHTHAVEKPAPLFAKKAHAPSNDDDDASHDNSQSVATLQGDGNRFPEGDLAYVTEVDGRPVVGDWLKIQFVEHQVVPTILDFFFRFPWNNFLHNVVYDVVQQVFNGTLERGYNRTLAFKLFTSVEETQLDSLGLASSSDITDRILDGQQASEESQKSKGMRLGYMGHLTLIAEEVCKFGNRQPTELIDGIVFDRITRQEWIDYVEGTLTETRERDNAVLGGVRPETAINRPMSMGLGGFSANTASALANAGITPQDSLAMSEGTVGQSFDRGGDGMLGGYSNSDDDEEMDYERDNERRGLGRFSAAEAFSDDEQGSSESKANRDSESSFPPPLKVAPSRARQQLAKRLAQRQKESATSAAADHVEGVERFTIPRHADDPIGPGLDDDLSGGLAPLRHGSANRFSNMFASDDSSSSGSEMEYDEDDAGRDLTIGRSEGDFEDDSAPSAGRPPRLHTTQAKQRQPLDEEDDDDDHINDDDDGEEDDRLGSVFDRKELLMGSEGPFSDPLLDVDDDSSDDEPVEIRPRRIS